MKLLRCAILAWIAAFTSAFAQSYVVNTIAGHGKLAYAGDGKAATSVNLFSPNRVAFDAAGNLYFTESYYQRVFKLGAAGTLTAIAGNGGETFAGEGGPATAAAIPDPEGIAVDPAGNVYVGTSARICKISGGQLHTIAGTGDDGYSGDHGPAVSAQIHTPEGIAIDGAGNIFFSDSDSHVVRRIGTDGIITTVAGGSGTPGYNGDGSPATSFQLNTPEGLAFDANGNLYIADSLNNRVRKLAPNGAISTFAGTGVAGDGGSGFAIGAKLFQPSGVAVDSTGNVYIADTANGLLKMVDPSSGAISTFSHAITSLGDVAVSPAGGLAAPDFLQQVINKIVWTSTTTTVTLAAGVVRTAALGDRGLATAAYFVDPWGLAADPTGNWYVADNGDQRVRKIGYQRRGTAGPEHRHRPILCSPGHQRPRLLLRFDQPPHPLPRRRVHNAAATARRHSHRSQCRDLPDRPGRARRDRHRLWHRDGPGIPGGRFARCVGSTAGHNPGGRADRI